MYFWNVKGLVQDLKENKVSETEKLKYYLLSGAFALLPSPEISWTESGIYIIIGTMALIWCFQANHRGDNRDFIGRVTCLFVPIGFRIYITGLLIGILALVLPILRH